MKAAMRIKRAYPGRLPTSFVLATFFMLLASVVTYNAYVKTFDDLNPSELCGAAGQRVCRFQNR
ncbi:MAG: hypothetical protein ACLRSW_07380 [Christensenellaceae bacterium]